MYYNDTLWIELSMKKIKDFCYRLFKCKEIPLALYKTISEKFKPQAVSYLGQYIRHWQPSSHSHTKGKWCQHVIQAFSVCQSLVFFIYKWNIKYLFPRPKLKVILTKLFLYHRFKSLFPEQLGHIWYIWQLS